jgi:hypothetical protein
MTRVNGRGPKGWTVVTAVATYAAPLRASRAAARARSGRTKSRRRTPLSTQCASQSNMSFDPTALRAAGQLRR